jgi:hypothetical protein
VARRNRQPEQHGGFCPPTLWMFGTAAHGVGAVLHAPVKKCRIQRTFAESTFHFLTLTTISTTSRMLTSGLRLRLATWARRARCHRDRQTTLSPRTWRGSSAEHLQAGGSRSRLAAHTCLRPVWDRPLGRQVTAARTGLRPRAVTLPLHRVQVRMVRVREVRLNRLLVVHVLYLWELLLLRFLCAAALATSVERPRRGWGHPAGCVDTLASPHTSPREGEGGRCVRAAVLWRRAVHAASKPPQNPPPAW